MFSYNIMNKLCSPAMLYLVISAIAIISAFFKKMSMMAIATKVVFVALWTWFLNYLCSKGHTGISWFLVFFPLLFYFLVLGLFMIKQNSTLVVAHGPEQHQDQMLYM